MWRGVGAVRGLLAVSSQGHERGDHEAPLPSGLVQLFTPLGVPLQAFSFGLEAFSDTSSGSGLCANDERLWVADTSSDRVYALELQGR